ncbi:MAG: hypothetical protein II777_10595 [Clostridia bacterium]|nr:hypothetical protein [Clostridia bacterium]
MNIDWKRKLTSRKFWIAVAGLVTGLILAFKGDAETAETVSGIIMAIASVVAYTIGEGLTDAAYAESNTTKESEIHITENKEIENKE